MRVDLSAIRRAEQDLASVAATVTPGDLGEMTNALVERQRTLLASAVDADLGFVPADPGAAAGQEPWTLGRVVVHATATSEEAGAVALTLARGIPVAGRSRYETPWQTVRTMDQLLHRLEESRRMRLRCSRPGPISRAWIRPCG